MSAWINNSQDILASAYQDRISQLKLTPQEVKTLGLELLNQQQTQQYINSCPAIGSIRIPYYDLDGNELEFCRLRYLNYDGKNKYIQRGGGVKVYLSPLIQNWREVLRSKSIPIIITEGEFKAIVACKNTSPTIALGGIYSFRSRHDRLNERNLLPIFKLFPKSKQIYIAFDGDKKESTRRNVQQAENTLAAILTAEGYNVKIINLLEGSEEVKVGLDDFILNGGNIEEKMDSAIALDSIEDNVRYQILSKYANLGGDVLYLESGEIKSVNKFKADISDLPDGYKIFQTSSHRLKVRKITFDPNEDSIITETNEYNKWRGYHTEPRRGNVDEWLRFMEAFFRDEPEIQEPFELFFAHYFQHPGVKQFRIPILRSRATGTGKSTVFETIKHIANGGQNPKLTGDFLPAAVLPGRSIGSNFNAIYESKNLLIFNEVDERGTRHTNFIKNLATDTELLIERKGVDSYLIPNYVNIAITTNEQYTHIVAEDSRREVVYDLVNQDTLVTLQEQFFSKGFHNKIWSEEYLSYLMHYYLTYPLNGYTGKEPAPKSQGKAAMADRSGDPVVVYIKEQLAEVNVVQHNLEYDLFVKWLGVINVRCNALQFRQTLLDNGFFKHTRASSVGQTNLDKYGLKKQNLTLRAPYHLHILYDKIALEFKERYMSDKI